MHWGVASARERSGDKVVGGNRLLAAALLGSLLGLTVGVIAELEAIGDVLLEYSALSLGVIVCPSIGFLVGESIAGRRGAAKAATAA